MFQFTQFPLPALFYSGRSNTPLGCWVSPFGHPRIKTCLAVPRGFSQLTTSFIGSRRQGIHRRLFVAWKNKDARARYAVLKGRQQKASKSQATSRPQGTPWKRKRERRRRHRAGREIRRSTTGRLTRAPSNQCINWVVLRWLNRMAEQSTG
jgi:hypothetical protein